MKIAKRISEFVGKNDGELFLLKYSFCASVVMYVFVAYYSILDMKSAESIVTFLVLTPLWVAIIAVLIMAASLIVFADAVIIVGIIELAFWVVKFIVKWGAEAVK